jgi:hypothetical protein
MSDKDQQLTPEAFKLFMRHVTELREFMAERATADADAAKKGDPPVGARDPFADAMD